jgi:hypothetical protein
MPRLRSAFVKSDGGSGARSDRIVVMVYVLMALVRQREYAVQVHRLVEETMMIALPSDHPLVKRPDEQSVTVKIFVALAKGSK